MTVSNVSAGGAITEAWGDSVADHCNAYGTFSGTTDASGSLVVTHGLGFTPACVIVQPGTPNGGTVSTRFTACNVTARSSTTFTIGRCVSQDGTLLASTAVTGYWMAAP